MESQKEDFLFREILRKSAGPMPFPDFEDELMKHIKASELRRDSIRKNLSLSWFFFSLGIIVGMLIIILLPGWHDLTGIIDSGQIARSFLVIGCLLVFFLFARNLLALTRKYKR
jgi:hypothetical protein